MNCTVRYFIILLISIVIYSCEELVTNEFGDFDSVPVVNSYLVTGDTLKVNVSLTEKLDSCELNFTNNASVNLYVDGVFTEQLSYSYNGWYISNTVVEKAKTYKCKVHIPGCDTVFCEQEIPDMPIIKNIEHINISGVDEEGTSYPAVIITFENLPDEDEYFEVEIRFKQNSEQVRTAIIHTIVDEVILDEGLPIALFSNQSITDTVYSLYLNYTTSQAQSSDNGPMRTTLYPFIVELRRVSYNYYRYKKQLYLYEEGRNADGILTSMVNTNLYSNIDGGYGIFGSYSDAFSDTITPNTDGYYE